MKGTGAATTVAGKGIFDTANTSWANLESRFNGLMDIMDAPTTGVNALEVREANRRRVRETISLLLDRAQAECRQLLMDGDGEAAELAGVKVLNLREKFYGSNSIELIPSYMHLARAKQYLEYCGDAEDMLSLAQVIMLKNQDKVTVQMKADLHQSFGLLYATDNNLETAVQHLTRATYYLSCVHGPHNVLTTFSYFDLANVFAAKASMENAMALYDAVKEIWYAHLITVLAEVVKLRADFETQRKYSEEDDVEGLRQACYASAHNFGNDNLADASKMMYGIHQIQRERFTPSHPSPTRAAFVLGLLLLWMEDEVEAESHLLLARKASQVFYGPRHPVVQEIEQWCNAFNIPLETADTEMGTGANTTISSKHSSSATEAAVEE